MVALLDVQAVLAQQQSGLCQAWQGCTRKLKMACGPAACTSAVPTPDMVPVEGWLLSTICLLSG